MESASFSFDAWCQRRGISRSKGYELLRSGNGPRTYLVGKLRFVSDAADREWVAEQEARPAPLRIPDSLRKISVTS
jgi:hypothetical protein